MINATKEDDRTLDLASIDLLELHIVNCRMNASSPAFTEANEQRTVLQLTCKMSVASKLRKKRQM
jgi:hypothetical protein